MDVFEASEIWLAGNVLRRGNRKAGSGEIDSPTASPVEYPLPTFFVSHVKRGHVTKMP
jgi:hypothetical protein